LECLTTTPASILVNGSPTDEFKFERGLCQGGPLSPFLYLLGAEGINVLINTTMEAGLFTSYSVGCSNNIYVSHRQFVDDTLLLRVKSWANVRSLKDYPLRQMLDP